VINHMIIIYLGRDTCYVCGYVCPVVSAKKIPAVREGNRAW